MKFKESHPTVQGIETMFIISSGNHQRISQMADKKAHILITVNAIVLTAFVSVIARNSAGLPYMFLPGCFLSGISLTTMIIAIIATRPTFAVGRSTVNEEHNESCNLLFFGDFHEMRLQDYHSAMNAVMADKKQLYTALISDHYAQGVILAKKYKILHAAYSIFLYGMILSVIAFMVASAFAHNALI